MKVLQINSTNSGSTGKICQGIKEIFKAKSNDENIILYLYGAKNKTDIILSSKAYRKLIALLSRVFGFYGFIASSNSKKIVKYVKKYNPDIIHLHNIHDHSLNLEILFAYLNTTNIKLIWTFHDCWAFTGYCSQYINIGCEKWKRECFACPCAHDFSWFVDNSRVLQNKKKKLYGNKDFVIVTPSHWLAKNVKQSFLGGNSIYVINNGIDLNVFKPTLSNYREKKHLQNKKIILGVAFEWTEKKGIDVFLNLSQIISDEYVILLVGGINSKYELPSNIIHIPRTNNQCELAELYTMADVFFNPTREDTFPTVNLESLACGTPVVTFDVGGCKETISEACGVTINSIPTVEIFKIIAHYASQKEQLSKECVKWASNYSKENKFKEYIDLYRCVFNEKKAIEYSK